MIQSENENMNRNNENKKMNSFIVICEPLIRLAVSSYAIEFMGKKKKPSLRPSSPGPLCEIEFKCPAGEHCQGSHCHGNLGNVYQCLGDIQRAREYHKQHLSIAKEVGDRAAEGRVCGNLGTAYHCLCDFNPKIIPFRKSCSAALRNSVLSFTLDG